MNLNAQNLEDYLWKNRILIIRTNSIESQKYLQQLENLKDSEDGLMDRKLVIYQFIKNEFYVIDFKNEKNGKSGKTSVEFEKKYFQKDKDFEVILIGLDGGIKLRQTEVLKKRDLYKTIDKMPMRRNEIRNKQE